MLQLPRWIQGRTKAVYNLRGSGVRRGLRVASATCFCGTPGKGREEKAKERQEGVAKMAQQMEALATTFDGMGLIPRARKVEENQLLQPILTSRCARACTEKEKKKCGGEFFEINSLYYVALAALELTM